ncbi:MAG: hypothetical protein ABL892_06265 [Thiobacillaceae bacterium]
MAEKPRQVSDQSNSNLGGLLMHLHLIKRKRFPCFAEVTDKAAALMTRVKLPVL